MVFLVVFLVFLAVFTSILTVLVRVFFLVWIVWIHRYSWYWYLSHPWLGRREVVKSRDVISDVRNDFGRPKFFRNVFRKASEKASENHGPTYGPSIPIATIDNFIRFYLNLIVTTPYILDHYWNHEERSYSRFGAWKCL